MFEIGTTLAAAREARGLELRDAERLTCMRQRYLQALEAERFDDLPGRTYARAFLRTYAAALGLDADRFVAEFDDQHPEPPEPELERVRRPRRVLPLAAAPAAGLVALVVVLIWSAWSNDHLGSNVAAPPPPPKASAAAKSVPRVTHVRAATKTLRRSTALVVRAVGGPCWVQARSGGPAGAVLEERTLEQGETLRLTQQHVWLRLGAPWNVRLSRGAHAVKLAATNVPVDVTA